jgi:hypothetical protein
MHWAQTIGGILGVNGFTNFMTNLEEAKAAMDEGLQVLATLAEYVMTRSTEGYINPPTSDPDRGKLPREWAGLFAATHLWEDKLADKTAKGRDTWVGTFLSGKTDRAVGITVGQQAGTATLRRNPVRNDQKRYFFEVSLSTSEACAPAPADGQQRTAPAPCGSGGTTPAATVAGGAAGGMPGHSLPPNPGQLPSPRQENDLTWV